MPELKGSEPITLPNIQEDSELVFTEAQLLNRFSDRDGDTLKVEDLTLVHESAGELIGDSHGGPLPQQ